MKYFRKSSNNNDNDMFVVENLNIFPVKTLKRPCCMLITNCSVNELWDQLATYDVAEELERAFEAEEVPYDIGLCSYLSQCIVNPMWEAHCETHTDVCDLSMIGNDFELSNGKIVTAEQVWDVLYEYFTVVNWNEDSSPIELRVEINAK